ncbi:hypothetical protein ABQZ09_02485 [Xanthomonas sp. WHRI 6106]
MHFGLRAAAMWRFSSTARVILVLLRGQRVGTQRCVAMMRARKRFPEWTTRCASPPPAFIMRQSRWSVYPRAHD